MPNGTWKLLIQRICACWEPICVCDLQYELCSSIYTQKHMCETMPLTGQPVAHTDTKPRFYCHVLSADKCLTMYTKFRNPTVWDDGWLNSSIVREFIRDVEDLTVTSYSPEFRTWTWCWFYHIADNCTSITFLALLHCTLLPFSVLVTRSWHNFPDDVLVRNGTFLSLTVNKSHSWWKGKKSLRLFCFLPRWESFSCCDSL